MNPISLTTEMSSERALEGLKMAFISLSMVSLPEIKMKWKIGRFEWLG